MKKPISELSKSNVNPGGEGATALPTAFNSKHEECRIFAANFANEREFFKFN
jgi:hypothetical protein